MSKCNIMARVKAFSRIFFCLLLLTLFAGTGSCFKEIVQTREPLPDIIWPKPPEIPRIRLVHAISRPEDMNISEGILSRFFRFVKGVESKSIVSPHGIAVDAQGTLYVVDNFTRLVHVFDENSGVYYTFPGNEASLVSPIGIAVDNNDTIYVSDSKEAVIKIFRNGGKKYIGEMGRGLLARPTGLAFNPGTEELLVADTQSSEIIRYDTRNHRLKGIIGKEGNTHGYLYKPTNLVISGDGDIVVSDSLNFRIQILSPNGKYINSFGSAGDGPGYFARPRGVAVDSDGNIYVVDALFDNVQIFNKQGSLLMAFGSPGNGFGEFWLPSGIHIDAKDRIYIADSYNHRVQIFKYLKDDEFVKD